jgi:hypothetical protein
MGSKGGNGLARYVVAAALAHIADGGAVVAVVLLVTSTDRALLTTLHQNAVGLRISDLTDTDLTVELT